MNFKFWEWFENWRKDKPEANPTDLSVLKEYQDAIGIERTPLQKLDSVGDGAVSSKEVTPPTLDDKPEDLKRKLQWGIHQSIMQGADTVSQSGVRAIGEKADVVLKINKSKLYELGYDIREENESFVKNLGLVPNKTTETDTETVTVSEIPLPVGANRNTSEEERLRLERIEFHHYSGKPDERPDNMRAAPLVGEYGQWDDNQFMAPTTLVVPEIEEEVKARIETFHAMAREHGTYCELYEHFTKHIDDQGNEFECDHDCKCKGKDDDQGYAVPV